MCFSALDLTTAPVESLARTSVRASFPGSDGTQSTGIQVAQGSSGFNRFGNGRSTGMTGI